MGHGKKGYCSGWPEPNRKIEEAEDEYMENEFMTQKVKDAYNRVTITINNEGRLLDGQDFKDLLEELVDNIKAQLNMLKEDTKDVK